MNPKERKALLEQIQRVKNIIEQHPYLEAAFPNIKAKVDQVHNSVAYEKVDEKDNALIVLNARRLKALDNFCHGIDAFRGSLNNINVDGSLLRRWLKAEKLQPLVASIKGLGGDAVFGLALEEMAEVVEKLKGGISLEVLREKLKAAGLAAFASIDTQKLIDTRSLQAVRNMGNPILEEFFFGRLNALPAKFDGPNMGALGAKLSECYNSAYFMTLADFQKNIQDWVSKVQGDLNKLSTDTYRHVRVSTAGVVNDTAKQFAGVSGKNGVFALVAKGVDDVLKKQTEGSNVGSLAESISKSLSGLASSLKPSEEDLQTIGEPTWVAQTLKDYIDLGSLLLQHADRNDAHFLVKLPNFPTDLRSRLNTWKADMENAMGRASGTVLALDSCKVDGPGFVAALSKGIKIPGVAQKFQALSSLKNTSIHDQKDLKLFEKTFITPWKTAIQGIDIEKDIIAPYEKDEAMLAQLFLNPYELLPDANDAVEALYLAIGQKRDLAREELNKFKQEVRQEITVIKADIKKLEDVTDLIQISTGYTSVLQWISSVSLNLERAHKERLVTINSYCQSFINSQKEIGDSISSFNDANKALAEFRKGIFDAVLDITITAITAGAIPPGSAGLVTGTMRIMNKGVEKLAKKVGKDVAGKMFEVSAKAIAGATAERIGWTSTPTLTNTDAGAGFQEYLTKQTESDKAILPIVSGLAKYYGIGTAYGTFIQGFFDRKISDIDPDYKAELIAEYNKYTQEVQTQLSELSCLIQEYSQQTAELAKLTNDPELELKMEFDAYVTIFEVSLKKEYKGDHWKVVSAAQKMRERLIKLKIITDKNFQDGVFVNSDWRADLSLLYAQKKKLGK